MVLAWHAALARAIRLAIEGGQLRAETDPEQMLFELHGLILALHHDARFLRSPGALDRARAGFERTLSHYALAESAAPAPAAERKPEVVLTPPLRKRRQTP